MKRFGRNSGLWLSLVGIGVAFYAQRQVGSGLLSDVALLYVLALLLVIVAWRTQTDPFPLSWPEGGPMRATDRSWWAWGLVAAALGLALLALRGVDPLAPSATLWWLHLSSILLFLAAVLWMESGESPVRGAGAAKVVDPGNVGVGAVGPTRRLDLLLLAAIGLLALFLRLYRFDSWPFGTWYDEAENGIQALRILENPAYRPIFVGSIHAPAHYLYLVAAAMNVLGTHTEAVRAVSVVMGLLTVPAAYLAGRELFGARMGLVLAFLMAVSRWNINFSRIGMYNISTPFFELLAIALLLRALRRRRRIDYAWCGLALGLGFCFYAAYQLFFGVVALFLLHLAVAQRSFLRRQWQGLLLLALGVLLVVIPVLYFAYQKPDIYFSRTRNTSIFTEVAPQERWPVLLESARKHLLMFTVRGDPNGRHNLPGEPMLDPWSSALFVLGIGLCLWHLRRPRALLLPLWLLIMLAAGIFSLSFEAPQSLRAIGTLPAAYLLAAVPLSMLWQAWDRTYVGARYPRLFVWPLLLLLGAMAVSNYQTYFGRQMHDFASWNAFSTPETIAAQLMAQAHAEADLYVISLFHNHPTVRFLAPEVTDYRRLETDDHLPIQRATDRDTLLIMDAERQDLYSQARRIYPDGTFTEHKPPFGGTTVVYEVRLTPADVARPQGLMAAYYQGQGWQGDPVLVRKEPTLQAEWPAAAPLPLPFAVEWEGVLSVAEYGPYRLILRAPDSAALYVDERLLVEGSGELTAELMLAQGNHALRLRAVGAPGKLELAWKQAGRAEEPVPQSAFYVAPVTANGLLGRYYANGAWQPPEAFAKIDPSLNLYFHVIPLPRPYTVLWEGKIAIPQGGRYLFGLESIDESELTIADQLVTAATVGNQLMEGAITLDAGLHDIQIRYADRTAHSHINLYWTPPGRGRDKVPTEMLFPPQGSYANLDLAALADLAALPELPRVTAQTTVLRVRDVAAYPVQDGLRRPKGVAVGPDGRLFIADTGNRRLLVVNPDGSLRARVERTDAPLEEPVAVAVGGDGRVYLLDAGSGRLSVFDLEGTYLGRVAVAELLASRSRGLHVDIEGRIWIANTAEQQVAAVDQEGTLLYQFRVQSGAESQPVDVLAAPDGRIFVTDVATRQLYQVDTRGRVLDAWDIPESNSVDGAHLAMDGVGRLYMTQPEQSSILVLAPDGGDGQEWRLPILAGQRMKPVGIAVDAEGRVWVADSDGGQVAAVAAEE